MESYIKKHINIFIALFLLISPILDLVTGVCIHYFHLQLTLGILIRVFFLISICFIALFIFKKKKLIIPYLIIGLYFVLNIIGVFLYKKTGLFIEIQNLVKVFYFPIVLMTLYSIREEINISKLTLFTVLFLYLIFIFIPTLFHIGYKTYEITKLGTLGFFNSANEISGIISILTPILFYVVAISKKWLPRILLMIMYLVVILMMGTKTPLLTFCITLGFSLAYLWVYLFKKKQYKKIGLSLGVVVIGIASLLLILPKTNFYKNIETHLDFLGIHSLHEVFEKEEYIDHFIFSQRLTFFHDRALTYKESNLYQKLFGIGYLKNGNEDKQIEMDYFDIYYNYGLFGFLIYFITVLNVLYKVLEKKGKKSFERYMTEVSVLLMFFLAFFTGHIFTTPAVSFICILLILSLKEHKKKQILIIEKEPKEYLKELEEDYHLTRWIKKDNILSYLWFKILYFQSQDITIFQKEDKEYEKVASNKSIIVVERKKKNETNKKYVTKTEFLKNTDFYLKTSE